MINQLKIYSKILSEPSCLNNARALLYKSYVKHLSWDIVDNNPSNIKINQCNHQITLTDDYDDLSVWFSVVLNNQIISCARLCGEDSNGLLEIERYENARNTIQPILDKKNELNLIELNREAILPEYSPHKELFGLLLLKRIFEHCLLKNQTLLTTCNISDWTSIYSLIDFKPLTNYSFKYFSSEPLPVQVYLATPEEYIRLIKKINQCLTGHKKEIINLNLIERII